MIGTLVNVLILTSLSTSVECYFGYSQSVINVANTYNPLVVLDKNCTEQNVKEQYRRALYDFAIDVFKILGNESGNNFMFSPLSLWLSLAVIGEGTDDVTQKELFKVLRLPEEKCLRQQYYMLGVTRETSSYDVTLARRRQIIVEESLILNQYWKSFTLNNLQTGIIAAPLKHDPIGSQFWIGNTFSVQPGLNMSGNSVIVDTLDYYGLWTSGFTEIKDHVPFRNDSGDVIGFVSMMKMKKRVKMVYIPEVRLKILELPIGYNGRYRIYFDMTANSGNIRSAINTLSVDLLFKAIEDIKMSRIPIDVSIPIFTTSSQIDMRKILQKLGVESIWNDPNVTGKISTPPVAPSSFIQRSSMTIDSRSLTPFNEDLIVEDEDSKSNDTGLAPELGTEFIADRPFTVTLVDTETFSCLFSSTFSTLFD